MRRIRKPGGGRKAAVEHQPGLLEALRNLLEGKTFGYPERVIFWTTMSLRKLQHCLNEQGFQISHPIVGDLLEKLGYSR